MYGVSQWRQLETVFAGQIGRWLLSVQREGYECPEAAARSRYTFASLNTLLLHPCCCCCCRLPLCRSHLYRCRYVKILSCWRWRWRVVNRSLATPTVTYLPNTATPHDTSAHPQILWVVPGVRKRATGPLNAAHWSAIRNFQISFTSRIYISVVSQVQGDPSCPTMQPNIGCIV